jgi:hypothetical protein
MAKRPPIPAELERAVLVEAGHRCAIPACRQVPVELAHIVGWARCKEHTFDNLIPLCPTCHTRFDRGEIDRKAMRLYKQNLAVLNRRYSDLELRVLEYFAEHSEAEEFLLMSEFEILLGKALADGLLVNTGMRTAFGKRDVEIRTIYRITPGGRAYVERWLASESPEAP